MRLHKEFAPHVITLARWFELKVWDFRVPFTENALIYFVRGKNRGEPISFEEVVGSARPYIPVEDVTVKRSKAAMERLGKAFEAVANKDVPSDVPWWQRRAFQKGYRRAIEEVRAEVKWQELQNEVS
jgi:hypothetical protein